MATPILITPPPPKKSVAKSVKATPGKSKPKKSKKK